MSRLTRAATAVCALSMLGLLAAPLGASAQEMATKTYEVTITNLTSKQAFSPPILVTHPSSAHLWQVGQKASDGLKLVAEEGMTDALAAEAKAVATDIQTASGPVAPGQSVTLSIKAHEGDVLSAATMLVQTNDGFTGLDSLSLAAASDKETAAYDGGVEQNTEKASDVPGPPFGGHNSGPQNDPREAIAMHPGIMSKADVGSEFNWTNPVARISVHESMMSGEKESMSGSTTTTSGESSMPTMPKTGAGDDGTGSWALALVALLSGVLAAAGVGLRKYAAARR